MKKQLRENLLSKRKTIINDNLKFVYNLKNIIKNYNKILIYYPIFNEPNILELINIYKNKDFYLPYTHEQYIEIRKIVDINDLEKDIYNVPTSKVKTTDEIEVAIVPAVAMNFDKYRLGYGKGYYDKFLKDKNILKIAVVNSEFLVKCNYQEKWDVKFDLIVTEKEVI